MEFVASPIPAKLEEVFNSLLSPAGRYHAVAFSDDSCFSIRHKGEVHVYNVDISKCDASHTEALFDALVKITPERGQEDMQRLTDQCGLPITISSLWDKKRRCILRPVHKLLYSGSTLTTAINNLATFLIMKAFVECRYDGPQSLIEAAESVGYVITLERCHLPEDIQFLKHSPVYDDTGVLRPMLNLGVLLRLSGTCKGDLPGRGDIQTRAESFQRGLLDGAYPYTQFTMLTNMKLAAGVSNEKVREVVAKILEYKVVDGKYPAYRVDPDSMYKRYRLTQTEILDLEIFSTLGYCGHFGGTSVDKVLGKDYGLSSRV